MTTPNPCTVQVCSTNWPFDYQNCGNPSVLTGTRDDACERHKAAVIHHSQTVEPSTT